MQIVIALLVLILLVLTARLLNAFADVLVTVVIANWEVFLIATVLAAAYFLYDMVCRAADRDIELHGEGQR